MATKRSGEQLESAPKKAATFVHYHETDPKDWVITLEGRDPRNNAKLQIDSPQIRLFRKDEAHEIAFPVQPSQFKGVASTKVMEVRMHVPEELAKWVEALEERVRGHVSEHSREILGKAMPDVTTVFTPALKRSSRYPPLLKCRLSVQGSESKITLKGKEVRGSGLEFVDEHSGETRWHRCPAELTVSPQIWVSGGRFGLHLLIKYARIGERKEKEEPIEDPFED
jgi:hypothetical protein